MIESENQAETGMSSWQEYSNYFISELVKLGFPESEAREQAQRLGEVILTSTLEELAKNNGIDISQIDVSDEAGKTEFLRRFSSEEYQSALAKASEAEVREYLTALAPPK